ncbi:MAG: ABC transporter substrate-binding protein [Gammaproteobacteria bacterium]|nr:ABC transporter substrate-binding protein [Gammaproteobacteria bacterium]
MKTVLKFLAFSLLSAFSTLALADSPQEMVIKTTDSLFELLKKEQDRLQSDPVFLRQQVDELILPHMDFNAMTKLAVGKNWRKATAKQRRELEAQFRELLVSTYANSLSEFAKHEIKFLPFRTSSRKNRAQVRSQVLQAGAASISMVYRLRKKKEQWKIYDITIDGISLVTNYRSSFTGEVSKNGIQGLIKVLQDKNQRLADKQTAVAEPS